jgi:putative transposase
MRSLKAQSHAVWDCKYHIVIVPKYRKKILYEPIRVQIGKIIRELASQKECEILEGGATQDHMHFVISIPPKHPVAGIIGFLKGKSAIKIHNTFSNKRSVTQKHFWSRGYYVSTVGIDEETIRKYVQNQWKNDQFYDGPQLDLRWN